MEQTINIMKLCNYNNSYFFLLLPNNTLQKIIRYFSKQERIGNYVKEINLAYLVKYQNNKQEVMRRISNQMTLDSDKNHLPLQHR